ncbi:WD40 repeat-like protein, partial [Patellaria atrata CBS 101060]
MDHIQEALNKINQKLAHPNFLKRLTPSQLPSQAASEGSITPPLDSASRRDSAAGAKRPPLNASSSTARIDNPRDNFTDIDEPQTAHFPFSSDQLSPDLDVAKLNLDEVTFDSPSTYLSKDQPEELGVTFADMAANFQTFHHDHQDLVLAVDFSFTGNRMVTASADHRLKVWDRKDGGENWAIIDTWRAHDAEVTDVKWNGPFTGEIIGSVGEDSRFRLWLEDPTETPCSGKRFKLLYSHMSETKIPYMALDFKNIMAETYLALISRDGYLSVYEPTDHQTMTEWQSIHQNYVCATPSRQDESSFRVSWHHEKLPSWNAVMAGVDRRSLSLAVAAMNVVKVFRTDSERRFYMAIELKGAKQLIRDVSWANGAMRGYDLIASASKDGYIRIYEVHTPRSKTNTRYPQVQPLLEAERERSAHKPSASQNIFGKTKKPTSGIGAGLAGRRESETVGHDDKGAVKVRHTLGQTFEFNARHGAVWRLAFSALG